MTSETVSHFSAAELAALLAFNADAGVEWLLEEEAVNRLVAPRAGGREAAAGPVVQTGDVASTGTQAGNAAGPQRGGRAPAARAPVASPPGPVAIPDEQAIAEARNLAAAAATPEALLEAMRGFSGCNLKNSARSTLLPMVRLAGP